MERYLLNMDYSRVINLAGVLNESSVILLGPRGTGKTTFLKTMYPQAHYIDLLAGETFRELSIRPETLGRSIPKDQNLVIIDEIQKLPGLLDEVHRILNNDRNMRFIMTGSSARKLKRQGVNLLAGRALSATMHPLTSAEVGIERIRDLMRTGGLPHVIDSSQPFDVLNSYVGLYLKEEIQAEGAVRGLEGFGRFLETAALCNGLVVNFSKIGNDAGISPRTISNYFGVLEDTLLGFMLPPYRLTKSRKAIASAKFFFFDLGVAHSLAKREQVARSSSDYGTALEHLVCLELRAALAYSRSRQQLTFWRTEGGVEVDFLIGNEVAIEVKAAERVQQRDCNGLRALAEDIELSRKIIVCHEKHEWRTDDGIDVMPLEVFLRRLWQGEILKG